MEKQEMKRKAIDKLWEMMNEAKELRECGYRKEAHEVMSQYFACAELLLEIGLITKEEEEAIY